METKKVSMDELAEFAVKLTKTVAAGKKAGPDNYSKLLSKTMPGLFSEAFSTFERMKKDLAGMDEATKAAYASEVKAHVLQAVENDKLAELAMNVIFRLAAREMTADNILDITLFIFGIMSIIPDSYINSIYSQSNIHDIRTNPLPEYWFHRIDGEGGLNFNAEGNYLVNSIPPSPATGTIPHYNAEIYNSPYTTMPPKNVTINPFPVDPPKEQSYLIYDFFINAPYAPANGVVFSAKIKAENLKGGSRGWGFWNTSLFLCNNFAWFAQYNGKDSQGHDYAFNGLWAQTRNASGEIWPPSSNIKIPDVDIEVFHEYKIELFEQSVNYYIDGICVAEVTDPKCIPNKPMAFHNWVDNELYFAEKPYMLFQRSGETRKNITKEMTIEYGRLIV